MKTMTLFEILLMSSPELLYQASRGALESVSVQGQTPITAGIQLTALAILAMDDTPKAWTAKAARYAKNKIAVTIPPVDGMYKSQAAYAAEEVHARYSNRERAYIMTPGQYQRFQGILHNQKKGA